jgi:DNA-directed RNA polymerase subunit RPC12/RpoP
MNGAQVFFYGVAYGQYLAAGAGAGGGSGAGGEDPNRPWVPKSGHEEDDTAPARKKRPPAEAASCNRKNDLPAAAAEAAAAGGEAAAAAAAARYACPICHRLFDALKAVHGHQRSHPERDWRGMAPPPPLPPVAADGKQYRYACHRCGAPFETRQALGGHRASHSGKLGCFSLSRKEELQSSAAVPPAAAPFIFPFDLNEPAPEQEEE